MKSLLLLLLVGACLAYTPITERSWVKFKNVPVPAYNSSLLHEAPNIIYAKEILIEERLNEVSKMIDKSLQDFHANMKRYTTDLTKRMKRATAKRDYGFVRKPELRHQYGMLFNHHGQVISGLKNMDLFLSIDLPKIEDIAHVPPPFLDCDNWAAPHKSNKNHHVYFSAHGFGRDNHGPMTELNSNTSDYLAEAIHITVCNQYKNKYIKLIERIETIKRNITYKIEKVMPRLMPNENAVLYGKETLSDASRQKRAIPLGLIFSGVSAIGGLIMKGVNTWSNYKKSKAMTKAVEKLYEAQEIDHRRLTRLEGQTSLLAKTTKTAFQHIDYRLLHLDTKLNSTVTHMTEFFNRTETQLRMCDKMGSIYYCQNSYVLRQRTQHTCESAIYYKMDAKTITNHCQAKFAANVEFTPKVLDAGETMVLFNLPRPWILLCGQEKQPTEIEFATYKVVDRKEFCECSLTAGSFQLGETLVKCTPEINSEADGRFKSYFAINKIIFDYLQAEKDVQLDSTVVQALSRLLDVKPEYDWTPLNWYVNPDLPDTVINKQPSSVIADLMGVMDHIITEGEEEAYQSEIQYRNAQSEFKRFLKSAEGWRKFEFISSILGLIALMALIIIAVFRSRIVESIILGSAVMDEYKFVNPSAPPACVKAFSLPPAYPNQIQFQPPTLPQNWGDKGAEGKQKLAAQMTAGITIILIIITLLAILYAIFKKCRYVSSLPRVCFPLYPFSTILRGTARTDIFVEVVNLALAEAMWAHFASVAVHPSQLRITGYPRAYDMHIIKLCCCRQLQVDWQNIILCDLDRNIIKLPALGKISIWSTNDLESIETNIPYQIRVYGRVLDLVIPLEIKDDVHITDHRLY